MTEGSLLGAAEVASLLGVTRQRVSQLKRDNPTFPPSGIGGFGASLWRRAGIQAWAAMHRPDRPEAGGRFVGEAARLLVASEQTAAEAGHSFVEAGHLWSAVCDGVAGSPLATTVSGVGINKAEVNAYLETLRGTDTRPHRTLGMNPRFQMFIVTADQRAAKSSRANVSVFDFLFAFVDSPREPDLSGRKQPGEHLLDLLERRGLDIDELRRRLLALEADPDAAADFESRPLRRRGRRAARPLLPGVELAPNPLGHDPRTRQPWGAAFGRTRDERSLVVDGEQWFFTIDGDGFYIRAADGRPIGYRYRIRPKPRHRPTNGFHEVLPMPPVELADWPDRRFGPEE